METLQENQKDFQQTLGCSVGSKSKNIDNPSTNLQSQGNLLPSGYHLVIYGQILRQIDAALLYLILDALGEKSIRLTITFMCLMPAVQRLLLKLCLSLLISPIYAFSITTFV
jgi:hypothetical protein